MDIEVNVTCSPTNDDFRYLNNTMQQAFILGKEGCENAELEALAKDMRSIVIGLTQKAFNEGRNFKGG